MNQNGSEDVYRVAFESAHTELDEILVSFEQLRIRKERIENVVEALKPILGLDEQIPVSAVKSSDESFDQNQEPAELESVQEAGESSADPFQRRIDLALREGVDSREPRKFARQFHR